MIELFDGRLTIIGTSHISKHSVELVKQHIEENKPTVVAVELDKTRLHALLHPKQRGKPHISMVTKIGITGYLFLLFASWAQKQLGKVVKLTPGADMLSAVKAAKKLNIPLALIDRDIQTTIMRLSMKLTWKERFRFLRDLVMGIFFPFREMERLGLQDFDLTRVPAEEVIEKMVKEFKNTYPSLYQVLVHERNVIMAKRLTKILQTDVHSVVAVVGAGHKKDLAKLVKKYLKQEEKKNQVNYTLTLGA